MHMNTKVMMYEDLKCISRSSESPKCHWSSPDGCRTTCEQTKEEACPVRGVIARFQSLLGYTYLTPPMKFIATKLAAKLSIRFQLRWSCCKKLVDTGRVLSEKHTCLYPNFA